MARSLIEEFRIDNPQFKDIDEKEFYGTLLEDFKSSNPQHKDTSYDEFVSTLNDSQPEKGMMGRTIDKAVERTPYLATAAAEGATGLIKKAASAFVPGIPKTPEEALDKTFPPLAIGEKAESLNKVYEESLDKYPLAYNGLDKLNSLMARTPAAAFDVAMMPGNFIRKAMGQPQNQVQSPDWLMNNKVAEFYDESVRQTDYVNKRWEGVSFEDVVKRADAKEITEYILHNVMASAPQNLAVLGLAATGFGNAGVIGMGILAGVDELKRARDMGKDPAMSALNAVEVGTFEAAYEKLGTLAFVEKWGGQLAKSFGKDTAFGIMKNVGKAMLAAVGVEGFEEVETSLSQDFARWSTGIDPNALKGSGWRAAGAFAVGGASGGLMTAPATIATGMGSAVTTINTETLNPETMAQLDKNLPSVSGFLKKIPTINVAPEKVNEAIITASVAKVEAISKGKSPEEAEIDSLHAFTKTLDPEPLVPQKKKAKGIIEYIKGWGGVDSTKEGGADFAELEIKGLVNDKNGKAPDHLVEKAIEDGFLPEQSTYNDLLALVEREQYSGPVLRQGDEAEGAIPERPLDSMSIESLDREIDRFQDMLGQGKAGKSIQLRLADLLEARKRRAQAEAEDMPDWVTEPLEGLEPDITPQKTVSSPTPGQMQGDAELARLARANQVEDDLIVSLVDQIERDDAIIAEDYEGKFDAGEGEVRGVIRHTPGGQFKAIIELARGATRKTARHEFMHFARKNLLDQKQIAVLEDAFQGNQEDEADAFGLYMAEGSAGNSLVDKVFKVLKDFVGRMGNWMKGRGFQTVEDIFKAIDQGKLGKRKSSRVLTPKDIQFSVEPKQIKEGRLRYKNPQKATAWLQSNGLYAAKEEVAPSGTNIAEDKNNVKPQFSVEQTKTPEFKKWFGDSKVVDENGDPKVVFHGTKRPDRIGSRFLKSRATSGPMSFFTSDAEIASGYATGKEDTSLAYEDTMYRDWYKVKIGRTKINIEQYWHYLPMEERQRLTKVLPHVTIQDNETGKMLPEPIILENDTALTGRDHWAWAIKEKRGNAIAAAVDTWLDSGTLIDREELFGDILRKAGITNFEYDHPYRAHSAVYPVYLSIQNPLDTSAIPANVVAALDASARFQRPSRSGASDIWDKKSRDASGWMEALKDDIAKGGNHAWTSIPDWVTGILKDLGYDGIKDVGGKYHDVKHTVWVPFEPMQIKSAVGNKGTFDPTKVSIQYSVERRAPTFFSAAEVILKEKMPNVASVAQVKAILAGIKQEEVKWLGVEQFLEGKEKVSKADMLDFVRANQVKVEEVVKGENTRNLQWSGREGSYGATDERGATWEILAEGPGFKIYRNGNRYNEESYSTLEEAKIVANNERDPALTKFSSYQLPGGENYREMLLTLPAKEVVKRAEGRIEQLDNGKFLLSVPGLQVELFDTRAAAEAKQAEITDRVGQVTKDENFRSSHFDEPNILAHVRFNERTGPKGERILFLEEVQSDWGQQGREKGFKGQLSAPEEAELQRLYRPSRENTPEENARFEELYKKKFNDSAVPPMPFSKTWHELALKRILRFGAENGFDVLAWTPGEPQAERYDLSKHINVLYYKKNADGTYEVEGNIANEGGQHSFGESIPAEKLADFVGKDVASKITAGEGGYSKSHEMNFLKGADLKVGGEGMSGFYDLMLPSFLNKYAKKWGARVSDFRLNETASNPKWPIATEYAQGKKPVHSLDITPSMKRDVLEVGQIQFSVERKDEPQVGQAIKAISDSIKASEVGGDYTLGDGETIKAEDLVDSMTLGEVTKEKAAGFLKAVKKGIHYLELPQNYLYAHEDSKPVAEGVIDAFVARERREHDIEEFKRVALSAPNPEALAEIVAAADRDNDVNIFAELTKAVKAGKITQADKEAFTKGLYFIHKAAKDQLIRDILASRVGVRIKSMGSRYFVTYETKDGKVQERWLTGNQMKALEARGTKVTVLEEKEQIKIKRGSPENGEIIESTRKVSSYDEALSILKEEEKQIIRELLPYRNYIPHARRGGKFWVEAYDQEGQKVYSARVPNESVAARMSELIGKEHPDWRIDAHPHSEKMRITPSFGSMADVQFFMNQNGIDPTSEPGQRIINAYRSVSPLMASLIHSQNIAGYKVDWDSIVDSMALMASSGSGRAYRLDVKDLMDDVKNIKDDFRFNTALQYVNALSEVQEDMPVVLQSIKSLTYFWLLANKSTYVIQNLTEPIWALARIESIKNPAGFAIVLNDEYKALLNRATEEGILKPFFSEQALAMNPLENLQKLDILGRASEVWSSRKVFEIGLRLARDNGLRGNEAYRYAYQFLFNKGKPFYSTANKPIGMLGKGWAVNRQYGFMLLNFMFDWLGKFARGMLRNKLMTLMAWVLLGGFGTLPFGRKLMELFKFQFEKNARNYDLLDRFMLGGIAGMLGISPSFIVPTVLKGIPLPSVNPFRSIDIIGNQIGFAAKSYEKYGIVGAAGYLPLAGGQYILRGQARLKDGFKDNKKIIYRPRTNYEKLLVGAGLNPFEVNEYYRTKEDRR